MIQSAGYLSTADSVKEIKGEDLAKDKDHVDFVILAGGDGTVHKIAKHLIEENLPIGLLPMGTANNIAKALNLPSDKQSIIDSWKTATTKAFDVGKLYGLGKRKFFLEGIGFGVFPRLMKEMRRQKKESITDPEKKLHTAVELLHDIVHSYKGRKCTIKIDGIEYSGKFLLVEIMNTRSIGPNLNLAPWADPGDGLLEIVMIPEEKRNEFLQYLSNKMEGTEKLTFFQTVRATKLEISWKGRLLHIDDEDVSIDESTNLTVIIKPGALKFLVPG
jgi:diacylglycerol kinase (ATP)